MKPLAALSLCFLACTARALDTDDLLDRVDTARSVHPVATAILTTFSIRD